MSSYQDKYGKNEPFPAGAGQDGDKSIHLALLIIKVELI